MKVVSTAAIWQDSGLTLVRVVVGLLLAYHGWEVFDAVKMEEYAAWDVFKQTPFALSMVYLGKGCELVAGLLLIVGFLTRLACLLSIGTMLYIAFFVGHGRIWYEDQHPFLFVLLSLVFFFTGPGKWSVDAVLEKKRTSDKPS